jgi:SAM-dependent methyltransferase
LLEVGAGSGWPALYLAARAGCDVTLTDLPPGALRIAMERAARDGIPGACQAGAADAAHLPFRDAHFDAINHSDVLCCLVQKRLLGDLHRARPIASGSCRGGRYRPGFRRIRQELSGTGRGDWLDDPGTP